MRSIGLFLGVTGLNGVPSFENMNSLASRYFLMASTLRAALPALAVRSNEPGLSSSDNSGAELRFSSACDGGVSSASVLFDAVVLLAVGGLLAA